MKYDCVTTSELNCFSLEVKEDTGILGQRDSGKEEVIRATFGLSEIKGGSILLHGKRIGKEDYWTRISVILYDPMEMFNPIYDIASHFVEVAVSHKRYTPEQAIEVAKDLIKTFNESEEILYTYPRKLSMIKLKKISIILASFLQPEYILIDDIEYGLSEIGRGVILNMLIDLKSLFNTTYLVFDNDPAVISRLTSYVVVMYRGDKVEEGYDVIEYPTHPYTIDLISGFLKDRNEKAERGCIYSLNCRFSSLNCLEKKPEYKRVNNRWVRCHGI